MATARAITVPAMPARKTWVEIKHDAAQNRPHVSSEHAYLRAKENDEVVWYSGSDRFTIIFQAGSPFTDEKFDVPRGGSVSSGPLREDVEVRTYKYSVKGVVGEPLDPDVIIRP